MPDRLPSAAKKFIKIAQGILHPTPPTMQKSTSGRIELERNGETAFLEYSLDGNVLELTHTEVPKNLRGMGLASSLAETALKWAREKNYKVDVVCSAVRAYIEKHPEYSDLVLG